MSVMVGRKRKMKIPKYIDKLLDKRIKAANTFMDADYELSHWIDQHEIEIETCDTYGGVDSICNPEASAARIREAIRNK